VQQDVRKERQRAWRRVEANVLSVEDETRLAEERDLQRVHMRRAAQAARLVRIRSARLTTFGRERAALMSEHAHTVHDVSPSNATS
jgi:hypothetical protein